ncbi:MAG TPA: hypothetical protein VGE09_03265 [Pseudoxanthomonas sp.]
MKDFAAEQQLLNRVARLEFELAKIEGSRDMLLVTLSTLIATHPDPETFREKLKLALEPRVDHPNEAHMAGFRLAVDCVRQALKVRDRTARPS